MATALRPTEGTEPGLQAALDHSSRNRRRYPLSQRFSGTTIKCGREGKVAGDGGRLYGRDRAITLVREFMDRPAQNRGRRVPIVVFTGSRGSGKTALLSDLARRLDQRVPYAYLDLETVDAPGTPELLSALAFDLNRHCATYGRLAFPRLIVGRIAMAQDLDLTDHHRARSQVEAALEAYRNVSRLR